MTATFGIEEELLVVDASSGHLVPRGPELLSMVGDGQNQHDEHHEHEDLIVSELNQSQVEINTEVCSTLDQGTDQLRNLRSAVARAGESIGVRPLALATHPWSTWHDQAVNTASSHYRALVDQYQQVAREMVICGCHVHVAVDDPDDRIRAMNTVTPWLPVLLALSANSPWWEGKDTGYASYRSTVWRSWPTATMPPRCRDQSEFEALITALLAVEAIDTRGAIYWYVRPSASLPTLEFRVADVCLRIDDAVTIAGLARALTVTAVEQRWDPELVPPTAVLDASLWRAARFGLDGQLVDPVSAGLAPAAEVVDTLLHLVEPALADAGDRERVGEGVRRILTDGNGARVQRRVLGAGADEWRRDRIDRIAAG